MAGPATVAVFIAGALATYLLGKGGDSLLDIQKKGDAYNKLKAAMTSMSSQKQHIIRRINGKKVGKDDAAFLVVTDDGTKALVYFDNRDLAPNQILLRVGKEGSDGILISQPVEAIDAEDLRKKLVEWKALIVNNKGRADNRKFA